MPRQQTTREFTLGKIEEMKARGIEPYPYDYRVDDTLQGIVGNPEMDRTYRTAGRVLRLRTMGKLSFGDIANIYAQLQVAFSRDLLGEERYGDFKKYVSSGDIISVEGDLFHTRTGELTLNVGDFAVLTKALYQIPNNWQGLTDKELRYRKRYLDLISNPEAGRVFIDRAKIITAVRQTLDGKGFIEVETPIIQDVYGGASARPFMTHVNFLNEDRPLGISPEIYLKKAVVGTLAPVYTIVRNFRNEGSDFFHHPEFTMMEAYQPYMNYNDMMELTEEIIRNALMAVEKGRRNTKIDFTTPFRRITMYDAIRQYSGLDVAKMDDDKLRGEMAIKGLETSGEYNRGLAIAGLFEEVAQPHLINPTFILDHPIETTPLCKPHRYKPGLIERFELFVKRMEIANAYTELNDPVIQRRLLEDQVRKREEGDEEAHPMDEDFLSAIETGLPPTGGLGIGIDRLVMVLAGIDNIKDVILFPMMRRQ